jgi:hypothetical protein
LNRTLIHDRIAIKIISQLNSNILFWIMLMSKKNCSSSLTLSPLYHNKLIRNVSKFYNLYFITNFICRIQSVNSLHLLAMYMLNINIIQLFTVNEELPSLSYSPSFAIKLLLYITVHYSRRILLPRVTACERSS